jgi:hypothetical protein
MTGFRVLGVVLVAALVCGSAGARQPVELQRLFPQQATISVEDSGLVRLPLPPEVLAACRPDLSDLRIFDASGREVAYLADSARGFSTGVEAKEFFEPDVLSLRREEATPEHAPPTHREQYELAVPPPSEAGGWELVIETGSKRFVREVSVAIAAPDGARRDLVSGYPLFRLDAETQRTRIPLGALAGERLLVTIDGREGTYLEPSFHYESARTFDSLRRVVVPLEPLSQRSRDGFTSIELQRPSGIVPDLLEIRTATGSFRRTVRVWDVQPGSDDARIGVGLLYRVAGPRGAKHLLVSLRTARGHALRVEIEDGDSPPLAEVGFDAVLSGPVLIFQLPSGTNEATLRFGGARAHRPRYDLSGLLLSKGQALSGERARAAAELYDAEALGLAQLGPIVDNPEFDATPALAFAMLGGATIDERMYEYRRVLSIAPSPEGLSRLRLVPKDVAAARADLADVRIVDSEGRQWPYLIERSAGKANVPIALIEQDRDGRTSVYRFAPSVAPLPLQRIRFDVQAPYFDRPYELLVRDEEGHERAVAKGRLRKDGRNPKPVSISFNSGRVRELELRIEDGDDAPLALGPVTARMRLPDLFLVAGVGSYVLLIGHPSGEAPRYELERVRDVVLAVKSMPVVSGPLEGNPDFSARSRLAPGSTLLQKGIVWAVLLAAALILGALTLRVARREPNAPSSGGANPNS